MEFDDGRRVGYARWGDASHPAILCFHGSPGSRHMAIGADFAAALSVQVICLDRPGFGLSDPAPDRTMLGWSDDVVSVANDLGVDEFAVIGGSAGCSYAIACGVLVPERVVQVGVVAGLVPPRVLRGRPPRRPAQPRRRRGDPSGPRAFRGVLGRS